MPLRLIWILPDGSGLGTESGQVGVAWRELPGGLTIDHASGPWEFWPEFWFDGLHDGDQWCLCVTRWKEALEAGCAPKVVLRATHISTLEFVTLDDLKQHAIDDN